MKPNRRERQTLPTVKAAPKALIPLIFAAVLPLTSGCGISTGKSSSSVVSSSAVSSIAEEVYFTVTFLDVNGGTLFVDKVLRSGTAVYEGDTPTKPSTEGFDYVFEGWDRKLTDVQENFSTSPTFITNAKTFGVYFKNWDGSKVFDTSTYYKGHPFFGIQENPTRPADNSFTYSFIGWNTDKDATDVIDLTAYSVTQDTYLYAIYASTKIDYTIVFYNYGKTVDTQTLHYGDPVSYQGSETISRAEDYKGTYRFLGWNTQEDAAQELDMTAVKVTGNMSFFAIYELTRKTYTVTFYDYDQTTILQQETYESDATPTYTKATPTRPSVSNTYTFTGWNKPLVAVTGDATYYATYSAVTNDLSYELSSDGSSYAVIKYTGTGTEIYIPAIYNNKPVTAIAQEAFKDLTAISKIEIPTSVEAVGNDAFSGCTALTYNYYDSDTNFTYFYLGNNTNPYQILVKVEKKTSSTGYLSAHIHADCVVLCNNVFKGYSMLTAVYGYSVYNKSSRVKLDGTIIKYIGDYAFSGTGLTNGAFVIPWKLKYIGEYAFYNVPDSVSVTIPSTVEYIAKTAFIGCTNLTAFFSSATNYKAANGCLYDERNNGLISLAKQYSTGDGNQTSISLNYDVYDSYCCASYTKYTINLSSNVSAIGEAAFSGTTNSTVALASKASSFAIGNKAYQNCSNLTSLSILSETGNSEITIGDYCFDNCTNIKGEIRLSDKVSSIGYHAFYGNANNTWIRFLGSNRPTNWDVSTGNFTSLNVYIYAETREATSGRTWCYSSKGEVLYYLNNEQILDGDYIGKQV
jgi:hypothetical protein